MVFIWILGFQLLMQVDGYRYLQDSRRPFSSCKPNEKWTWKRKRTFSYEMVNSGYIYKDQVDNFVKCLKLVLVYRMFYKETIGCKGFRTCVDSKTVTLTPWKRNYYSIIMKGFWLKSLNTRFFKNNFAKTQEPIFFIYYLSSFLPWNFHVWNLYCEQFLT